MGRKRSEEHERLLWAVALDQTDWFIASIFWGVVSNSRIQSFLDQLVKDGDLEVRISNNQYKSKEYRWVN